MAFVKQIGSKNLQSRRQSPQWFLCVITILISTYWFGVDTSVAMAVHDSSLCVQGRVIDHNERGAGAGWTIYAVRVDENGQQQANTQMYTRTNANGQFTFQHGLYWGMWQFSIETESGWSSITAQTFEKFFSQGSSSNCHNIYFQVAPLTALTVLEIDQDHTPQPGWIIKAEPGDDNWYAKPVAMRTGSNGKATFYLTPGRWVFIQQAPNQTAYKPIIPLHNALEVDVELSDEPKTVRFKNLVSHKSCINTAVMDIPSDGSDAFGLPGWYIEVQEHDGNVVRTGHTDALGNLNFTDLPLGPYKVIAETRQGWTPTMETELDVHITENANCASAIFVQQQISPGYCVIGSKIDFETDAGIPGWKVTARPLREGGYIPPEAVTNAEGQFRFDFPNRDYRISGATYELCEESRDDSPYESICHIVTLPNMPQTSCLNLRDHDSSGDAGHGGCNTTHIAQPGDSLYAVGYQYGVSSHAILAANPWIQSQQNHWLLMGQHICIPG